MPHYKVNVFILRSVSYPIVQIKAFALNDDWFHLEIDCDTS